MKARIGYAAMLTHHHPNEIVRYAQLAEEHGFSGVLAADHFQPWVSAQGHASFVWNVMAAVAERTTGGVGPGDACPSFRQHPAVVAQAAATMAAMYPGRHWLGLGSGDALNEHVVGGYWPQAPERIARLFEAIEIIQKLFSGKEVRHTGSHFRLEKTRLWTLPETPPPIYVATGGPVTAKRAGASCDGIITLGAPVDKVAALFRRFDEGARSAGKDPALGPKILQVHLSWAPTDAEALSNALTHWPNGAMRFPKGDLRSPADFEQIAKLVRPEDFADRVLISADPQVHRDQLQRFLDLGATHLFLHNVGRNQEEWIRVFGEQVLPKLHA